MVDLPPPTGCTWRFGVAISNARHIVGAALHHTYQNPRYILHDKAVLWGPGTKGAAEQLADLIALVKKFNLAQGIANSLDAKLQNIQKAVTAVKQNDRSTAWNELKALVNEAHAQSGKELTSDQANQIIEAAERIMAVLG